MHKNLYNLSTLSDSHWVSGPRIETDISPKKKTNWKPILKIHPTLVSFYTNQVNKCQGPMLERLLGTRGSSCVIADDVSRLNLFGENLAAYNKNF